VKTRPAFVAQNASLSLAGVRQYTFNTRWFEQFVTVRDQAAGVDQTVPRTDAVDNTIPLLVYRQTSTP
jgi:hypothetical protein